MLFKKQKPKWNPAFLAAALEIAQNETLEPAFKAMTLTLPSETELARMIGRNINPDAIHSARKSLLAILGENLESVRESIIAGLLPSTSYFFAVNFHGFKAESKNGSLFF